MGEIWCVVSIYSDGSGEPEVIFVSDDEATLDAVMRSIKAADPVKRIAKVCPSTVLLLHHEYSPSLTSP